VLRSAGKANTTRLRAAFALSAAGVLAACAGGDMGKSTGSTAAPASAQMVYPTGVITTAEALPETRGIYAVPVGGGEQCCWVDKDVHFVLPIPDGAKSLHVDVSVPVLPGFSGKKQTIAELDSTGKSIATRSVAVGGSRTVTFPLPSGRAYGLVLRVHLRMSMAVVPHAVGAGPDVRRLAMVVSGAYAR